MRTCPLLGRALAELGLGEGRQWILFLDGWGLLACFCVLWNRGFVDVGVDLLWILSSTEYRKGRLISTYSVEFWNEWLLFLLR